MKKLLTILAVAVLAAVLAVGMAACNGGGKDPKPGTQSVTVSDGYGYGGIMTTADGREVIFAYSLPEITGSDSDYIYGINQELAQIKKDYVDPGVAAIQRGEEPGWPSVCYTARPVGNIVSIMLDMQNMYTNIPDYRIWNIKADGTQATNAELLAAKGVSEADFLAKVKDTLIALNDFDYNQVMQAAGKDMADEMQAAYNRTLSEENINIHMPIYINDEGHLAVIAKSYTIAGAGYVIRYLDLGW